jgi:hypothetical protein
VIDMLTEQVPATLTAGPSPHGFGERATQQRPAGSLRWVVENVARLTAALVVAGYGLSKPAYDAFYAALGLTPADVGQNQVTMLMRGAVNLAMVLGSLLGLAAIFLLIRKSLLENFGRSARFANTIAAATLPPVVTAGIMMVPSRSRQGALVVAVLIVTLAIPLYLFFAGLRNGHVVRRALVLVLTLSLASYAFQFYLVAARHEGESFLNTASVDGVWPFALYIRDSRVHLVDLADDPARVCTRRAEHFHLGGSNGFDYVLVLGGDAPIVARLSNEQYAFRYAVPEHPARCILPNSESSPWR